MRLSKEDFLNTIFVSKEKAYERAKICESCPSFISKIAMCKECGCFMKMKVTVKLAECPLGKWNKED